MVIDMHGHPVFGSGTPSLQFGVDPKSKYVSPKNQAEANSRMAKDISKMAKQMDKTLINKRVLLAFGKDIDPMFNYAKFDPSTGVTTPSSNEWIRKTIGRKNY